MRRIMLNTPPLLPYAYIQFDTLISNPANITTSEDR